MKKNQATKSTIPMVSSRIRNLVTISNVPELVEMG